MTPVERARLAAAITALRPDWPAQSLLTFLTEQLPHRPLRDVAVALTWVATDPDSRTPARVLEAGPWWAAAVTSDVPRAAVSTCREHPTATVRLDQRTGNTTCADCHVDAHAADEPLPMRDRGGRPIPDPVRREMTAAMRGDR